MSMSLNDRSLSFLRAVSIGFIGIILTKAKVMSAEHFQILTSLPFPAGSPVSPVILGNDGALYGTASWQIGNLSDGFSFNVFRMKPDGSGFRVLASLGDGGGDSGFLPAALLQGSDGALYGSSYEGFELNGFNTGVVFRLKSDGSGYQALHTFQNDDEQERIPSGVLVEGTDGAVYGTTSQRAPGVANVHQNTVFKVAMNGAGYEVLHSFDDISGDVEWGLIMSGLTTSGDGVLYGTTAAGGANASGSVFRVNEDGSGYQVLHHFGAASDGAQPNAPPLAAKDGMLYGTTMMGGAPSAGGWGTVFRLSRDGSNYQVIHSFYAEEGRWPQGALMEAFDGTLYGTLSDGDGLGAVFRLSKDGSGFRIIHSFTGTPSFEDPGVGHPLAGVTPGLDGALYGTTSGNTISAYENGGQYAGAVFKLWPPETPDLHGVLVSGNETLVTFDGESGLRYEIMRSTNLIDWSTLDFVVMPDAGTFSYSDSAPPQSGAWYRIAWQP